MPDDEKVIDKIRKLLALATSSNENEAALAAAKAQDLLLKHNLDMARIERAAQAKPDPYMRVDEDEYNRANWEIDLAVAVAHANLCKIVVTHPEYRKDVLAWMGKESNLEVAQFIFATLVQDLTRIAADKWGVIFGIRKMIENNPDLANSPAFAEYMTPQQLYELRNIHGKAWKNAFYLGAVAAIRERLVNNLETLKRSDTNMNALIVVLGSELQQYVVTQFPRLGYRTVRQGTVSGGAYRGAYQIGRAAGSTLQFRNGIGGGGSNAPKRLGGGR